jgi:hypothetical protein
MNYQAYKKDGIWYYSQVKKGFDGYYHRTGIYVTDVRKAIR